MSHYVHLGAATTASAASTSPFGFDVDDLAARIGQRVADRVSTEVARAVGGAEARRRAGRVGRKEVVRAAAVAAVQQVQRRPRQWHAVWRVAVTAVAVTTAA